MGAYAKLRRLRLPIVPVFSSVGTFPWTWRLFVICPFLSSFRLWLLLGLVLVLLEVVLV